MKEFYVVLNGLWSFDFVIDANSKEEAEILAMELMDKDHGPIDIEHVDQHAEEMKKSSGVGGPDIDDMKISYKNFNKIRMGKYNEAETP